MANSAANVRVGATGVVSHAPTGTALPTDTTTALNVAFVDVGYIADSGLTGDPTNDANDIYAWGGDRVRKVVTNYGEEWQFTMLERNANSITAYYGNGTTTSWQGQLIQVRKAWVFHITDGTTKLRIVLPDAEVTDHGAVTYNTSDAIAWPVTVSTYPNASGVHSFYYAS